MRPFMVAALMALAGAAAAGTWRWTDDQGNVHFSDNPPSGRDAERIELPNPGAPGGDDRTGARQKRALELLRQDDTPRRPEENTGAGERPSEQQRECDQKQGKLAELKRNPPLMREDFPGLLYEEHRTYERKVERLEQWLDDNC